MRGRDEDGVEEVEKDARVKEEEGGWEAEQDGGTEANKVEMEEVTGGWEDSISVRQASRNAGSTLI